MEHRAVFMESGQDGRGGRSEHNRQIIPWGLFILALFPVIVWGLYHGALHGPFVFDDLAQIEDNYPLHLKNIGLAPIWEGLRDSRLSSRFVANFSFMLNYKSGGLNPFGFHLINLGVHAMTGILLFFLLRTTLCIANAGQKGETPDRVSAAAFGAALLWLVHPLCTQTTSYIVQRMNGLSSLFYIAGLLCYAQGRMQGRRSLFFACALFFVLSMGSKEIGITLPFMILLYEWYFFQDLDFSWLKRKIPWFGAVFVLAVVIGFVHFDFHPVQGIKDFYGIRDFTLTERLLTQCRVVLFYISLIVFPFPGRLNLEHDFALSHSLVDPISTLYSLLTILVLLGIAAGMAKKHRVFSFCIFWYFINLALESSFIPLELVFEHRTYLPSMMVVLIPVLLVYKALGNNKTAALMCLGAAVLLAAGTMQRNEVWADRNLLMIDCMNKSPNKSRVLHNYATVLGEESAGRYGEAIVYYQRALEKDPRSVSSHILLGALMGRTGMIHQGFKHLKQALNMEPSSHKAYFNMGMLFMNAQKLHEATACFDKALALEPRYAPAVHNRGIAYQMMGDIEKAELFMRRSLELAPLDPIGHYNYAMFMKQSGDYGIARRHFQRALDLAVKFGKDSYAAQARAALGELGGKS